MIPQIMEESGAVPATVSSLKVLPTLATVRQFMDGKAVKLSSEKGEQGISQETCQHNQHHSLRVKGYGGEKTYHFLSPIPEKAMM